MKIYPKVPSGGLACCHFLMGFAQPKLNLFYLSFTFSQLLVCVFFLSEESLHDGFGRILHFDQMQLCHRTIILTTIL